MFQLGHTHFGSEYVSLPLFKWEHEKGQISCNLKMAKTWFFETGSFKMKFAFNFQGMLSYIFFSLSSFYPT